MADGSVREAGQPEEVALRSPDLSKPFSMDDAYEIHTRLLALRSLSQVLQAAATGDLDMADAGIFGTAALLERQVDEAIELLGL